MKNINKILGTIALATTIGAGCKTIEEGVFYKTKEYVGKLEYAKQMEKTFFEPKKTFIQTDSMSFIVKGHPDIKPGTWCYVTYDRIPLQGGNSRGTINFTWLGTEKKHLVKGRRRGF